MNKVINGVLHFENYEGKYTPFSITAVTSKYTALKNYASNDETEIKHLTNKLTKADSKIKTLESYIDKIQPKIKEKNP